MSILILTTCIGRPSSRRSWAISRSRTRGCRRKPAVHPSRSPSPGPSPGPSPSPSPNPNPNQAEASRAAAAAEAEAAAAAPTKRALEDGAAARRDLEVEIAALRAALSAAAEEAQARVGSSK